MKTPFERTKLTYYYNTALSNTISRLEFALESNFGVVELYEYIGLGTVVRRARPVENLELTYVKLSGESDGDAGDKYIGLDRFGRIVDQRWIDSTDLTDFDRYQYGYDRNGNRLFRDNLMNTALGELYTYDGFNQIASFQRGTLNSTRTAITGTVARSQSWDYDALGNWDSVTTNGTAQTRGANAQNEITSISGATTPTYDANGNMTADESGLKFVYDAWNRLVVVKNAAGTITLETLTYDGLNRRVLTDVGGTTTDFYYSAQWQVIQEDKWAGVPTVVYTTAYVWSPVYVDALVVRFADTDGDTTLDQMIWAQQDANWNVTSILIPDTKGDAERFIYDPFGGVTILDKGWSVLSASGYDWLYMHQGGRIDPVTGNYHFRNRDYSPTLGRWTSLDPIRFEAGDVNLYRAYSNTPTGATDPSGLQDKPQKIAPTERMLAISQEYAVLRALELLKEAKKNPNNLPPELEPYKNIPKEDLSDAELQRLLVRQLKEAKLSELMKQAQKNTVTNNLMVQQAEADARAAAMQAKPAKLAQTGGPDFLLALDQITPRKPDFVGIQLSFLPWTPGGPGINVTRDKWGNTYYCFPTWTTSYPFGVGAGITVGWYKDGTGDSKSTIDTISGKSVEWSAVYIVGATYGKSESGPVYAGVTFGTPTVGWTQTDLKPIQK